MSKYHDGSVAKITNNNNYHTSYYFPWGLFSYFSKPTDDESGNQSETLKLANLATKEVIKIITNDFDRLPDDFNMLKQVKELRLIRNIFDSGTGIKDLPNSISEAKTIEILDLQYNELSSFPLPICSLVNLCELNLNSCNITNIHVNFRNLTCLKTLILDNNGISVPKNIPKNVVSLSLVNNMIEDDTDSLMALHKICTLDLSQNHITVLSDNFFSHMECMQKFYIRENQLEGLPSSIYGLTELRLLNVSKNRLRHISGDLLLLKNLRHLNISSNQVTALPKSLTNLENLEQVNFICGENPLHKPPLEVSMKGFQTIQSYFKSLDKEAEIHNKRIKLMVLGESQAGKTSLAKAIITGAELKPNEKETTIGLEFLNWKAQPMDSQGLEVLIVDCAGQRKYMLTHQLFLCEGALYVIVVNLEKYDSTSFDKCVGYWIDQITARVPKATIIIAPTHLDLLTSDQTQKRCTDIIRSAHRHIKKKRKENGDSGLQSLACPFLPTSYKTLPEKCTEVVEKSELIHLIPVSNVGNLSGLALLKEEIIRIAYNKTLSPNTHHVVPKSWVCLEKWCINERKYRKYPIVAIDDLMDEVKCFDSKADMIEALKYIDSVGPLLYFHNVEGAHNVVFLHPKWLLKLLKLVYRHDLAAMSYKKEFLERFGLCESEFEQEKNFLLNGALLSKTLLRCLWMSEIDDDALFQQVTEILQSFHLMFDANLQSLNQGHERLLIPWFFQEAPPYSLTESPMAADQKRIITKLETRDVCPDGFFQRFVAKVYTLNLFENCVPWKHGFYGLSKCGSILCRHETSQCSSSIIIEGRAEEAHIYNVWKDIIPIIKLLQSFLEEWKGLSAGLFSVCPFDHDQPEIWRLDISNLVVCENLLKSCQRYMKVIDAWLIVPPPNVLLPFLDECHVRTKQRKNLDEFLERQEVDEICKRLHHQSEALIRVLEVDSSRLQPIHSATDFYERTFSIVQIWTYGTNPTRRVFLNALDRLYPYPHVVANLLLFKNMP